MLVLFSPTLLPLTLVTLHEFRRVGAEGAEARQRAERADSEDLDVGGPDTEGAGRACEYRGHGHGGYKHEEASCHSQSLGQLCRKI